MRKRISGKKLNRTTNARKQLFRQLVKSLADRGRLVTTEAKASAIRPIAEKLVNMAKGQNSTNFRRLVAATSDVETAKKLSDLGKLFTKRPGGYTRILKLGRRNGDGAELVQLEWVEQLTVAQPVAKPEVTDIKNPQTVEDSKITAAESERKVGQVKGKVTEHKKRVKT